MLIQSNNCREEQFKSTYQEPFHSAAWCFTIARRTAAFKHINLDDEKVTCGSTGYPRCQQTAGWSVVTDDGVGAGFLQVDRMM